MSSSTKTYRTIGYSLFLAGSIGIGYIISNLPEKSKVNTAFLEVQKTENKIDSLDAVLTSLTPVSKMLNANKDTTELYAKKINEEINESRNLLETQRQTYSNVNYNYTASTLLSMLGVIFGMSVAGIGSLTSSKKDKK